MKKLIFSISALMMCLIMTSCSKLGKLQSMADDMKENGKSWTADEWEQYLLDMADATLAFWDSEPSKEDIKEYDKINKQMERTMEKVAKGKKVQKALDKAMKKLEKNRDFKSAVRKLEKLEKNKVLKTYDPSIHDYSVDKPSMVDLGNGHFIYGNAAEIENYKKRAVEKFGEMPRQIDIKVDGEEVELQYHLASEHFDRIRRITGYLVGTLDRFNDAKRAEEHDRVKHATGCDCGHDHA